MNLPTLILALRKATNAACDGDPESENMLEAIISDLEKEAAGLSPTEEGKVVMTKDEWKREATQMFKNGYSAAIDSLEAGLAALDQTLMIGEKK